MRSRVMYIEDKSSGLTGPCRIGRVTFSKTGSTLRYGGREFQSLKGFGFKANYFDVENGQQFWISGPRKDGVDGLYGRVTQPEDVDADVAEEYWLKIRGLETVPDVASSGSLPTMKGATLGHGRKAARIAKAVSAKVTT